MSQPPHHHGSGPAGYPYGQQPADGPVDETTWQGPGSPIPSYIPPPPPAPQPPQPGPQSGPWGAPQAQDHPQPYGYGLHQAPQRRYAEWGERAGASLFDWGVLLVGIMAASALGEISDGLGTLATMAWLALAGYIAWLNGSKGQSPGKALVGLKVIRATDGQTLGGPVGVVRAFLLSLAGAMTGGLLFALAVLWPLWDPKKQALHDKLLNAEVITGEPRAKFGKDIFKP